MGLHLLLEELLGLLDEPTGILPDLPIRISFESRVATLVPMRRTDFAAPDPVENSDANDTLFDDGKGAVREVGLG